jgi:hypothetical protein
MTALFALIFSHFVFAKDDSAGKTQKKFKEVSLEEIDQFATGAPLFIKDYSLEAIRGIGKIIKEETKKTENLHDQRKINFEKTFHFEGLTIEGLVVVDKTIGEEKGSSEVLLSSITVTSPQWRILHGLEVGAPAEKLLEVLGTPYEDINSVIKYAGTTEEIHFFIKQKKIEKIHFIYYLD